MKKVLSMLCVLLAFTLVGCDKENDVNGSDQPSGGESSGEGEGGAAAEISEISADASVEMDVDWTNGVIINVTIAPANASMADVAAEVADESIVSIEKEGNGFRVKPKKVGSTTVKIKATRGAASSKTCSVKVNEKGMTTVVEVTKCELVSGDSMDKRTLQDFAQLNGSFKVKLTPSNAKLADDMTWSADTDWVESMGVQGTNYGSGTYGFEIKLKKNSSHLSNRTGTMNITFKSKKGNASLKVPITVCGHIYKVEFPVLSQTSNDKIENGEVYLNGGESLTITPTISKTGNLLSTDGLEFTTPSSSYGISVSSSYSLSVASSPTSWAPNGVILTCKDKSGAFSTSAMKVHTYAKPTGIEISVASGSSKSSYVKGDKIDFNVKVSPSAARQLWETSLAGGVFSLKSKAASSFTVEVTSNGDYDKKSVSAYAKANSSIKGSVELTIDSYKDSDAKIGDYVIQSGSSSFRIADGGIRFLSDKGVRGTVNSPSLISGEQVIGIVFKTLSDSEVNTLKSTYGVQLMAFSNNSSHVGMISITDAGSYRWCDENDTHDNIKGTWSESMNGAWGTPPGDSYLRSTVPNALAYDVYRCHCGWRAFNTYRGVSHKAKAIYPSESYGATTSDYTSKTFPVPIGSGSKLGTTGWLLPTGYLLSFQTTQLNSRLAKVSGAQQLTGSYWTACYSTSDKSKAFLMDLSGNTQVTAAKSSNQKSRPVCYL